MEYKILINNNDFKIKKLHELSITEYNKIFNIIEDNDYYSLLYMLTDIPAKYMDFIPEDITVDNFKENNNPQRIKDAYCHEISRLLSTYNFQNASEMSH